MGLDELSALVGGYEQTIRRLRDENEPLRKEAAALRTCLEAVLGAAVFLRDRVRDEGIDVVDGSYEALFRVADCSIDSAARRLGMTDLIASGAAARAKRKETPDA